MTLYELALYSLVIFSVSIVPGPSMLLAFTEGATGRINGALPAALGNMLATLVQGTVAFLAFRSIASLSQDVLLAIQILGAAYIAYVGVIFVNSRNSVRLSDSEVGLRSRNTSSRFRDGFLVALLNPKAILFFIALFPQFTSSVDGNSLLGLVAVFAPISLIALICFLLYSLAGQSSALFLSNQQIFSIIVPIMGVLLIVTATVSVVMALFR